MKISMKKLVATALCTTMKYTNETTISYNDLSRYIELLESQNRENYEVEQEEINLNEDNIIYVITNNMFFSINPSIFPHEFLKYNDTSIILGKQYLQKYIDGLNIQENRNVKKAIMQEYRRLYLSQVKSIDEFMGKCPQEPIEFTDFITIYALEYFKICGNTIFFIDLMEDANTMANYLKSRNFEVKNLKLAVIFSLNKKYPNIFQLNNNKLVINIDDIDNFRKQILDNVGKETYDYIRKLIELYIVSEKLDPEVMTTKKRPH